MTLADIIERVRRNPLEDYITPYLWSDDEITDVCNTAIDDLCEQCFLIEDSTTTAICDVAVVKDTAIYTIDSRIIKIIRVRLSTAKVILVPKTIEYMDAYNTNWEDAASGTPSIYITDGFGRNKIRLYLTPDAADTLKLIVFRRQATSLTVTDMSKSPEIPTEYHPYLFDGIAFRLFQKQDVDSVDPQKEAKHYKLWNLNIEEIKRKELRRKQGDMVAVPHLANI